jgi:hypothetical protein
MICDANAKSVFYCTKPEPDYLFEIYAKGLGVEGDQVITFFSVLFPQIMKFGVD